MKLNNYSHVIWDWNGTILDDVHLCLEIINNILKQENLKQISLEGYRDNFTIPVKAYYEKIGLVNNDLEFKIQGKKWTEEYEKRKMECSVFDDIETTMSDLKKLGIQQSILSAYMQQPLEETVGHFKLTAFLENIVGSDNIYGKSKIDMGKNLIKKIGCQPDRVLMIGDTLHDFEVAEAIGADCLLIARGHQSSKIMAGVVPNILDSLPAIACQN